MELTLCAPSLVLRRGELVVINDLQAQRPTATQKKQMMPPIKNDSIMVQGSSSTSDV